MKIKMQMKPNDMGGHDLRGLLTCGHWSTWTFECSSTWDFPMDEQTCTTCDDARYFDLQLQAQLLNDEVIDAEAVEA